MKIRARRILASINKKKLRFYLRRKNIILGANLEIDKKPMVDIHRDAKLVIGDNVTLNSNNHGYHVNMFAPCKLMADKPYAMIEIGDNSRIHGSCIHAHKKITIGKNCLIAANCQIIDGNAHELSFPDVSNRINTRSEGKEVIIEDNVWLGTGVVVLPGVKIGAGSVISANSVVHKDIPAMVVAGGNPVTIIKRFEEDA
jgi:acetyltransferase-like isoleucine patch superfamily enzyme